LKKDEFRNQVLTANMKASQIESKLID